MLAVVRHQVEIKPSLSAAYRYETAVITTILSPISVPLTMPPESSANPRMRQYQKNSKYTSEERAIIEPYRDAFRSQESKAGRLQILKCDILPAIFNYWRTTGNDPQDEVESRIRAKVNYQACQACQVCNFDHIARN